MAQFSADALDAVAYRGKAVVSVPRVTGNFCGRARG
jgi:hypothetical protein